MPEPKSPYKRVRRAFSQDDLKRVCEMHESEFEEAYGMKKVIVDQAEPSNFYLYKDNGSAILAVAHLDTVAPHEKRTARFCATESGAVVFSRALDDRLGAYTILELLPKLGINYDILLTVGEEQGKSTAAFFLPDTGVEYNWMIEFDRGGTDVVMYQYDDPETRALVRRTGAQIGDGIFSDISYLGHLEVKGFNWGVGYQNYHGPRAHAFINDYQMMIGHYLKFHDYNHDVYLPHDGDVGKRGYHSRYSSWDSGWADADWERQYSSASHAPLSEQEIRQDLIALGIDPDEILEDGETFTSVNLEDEADINDVVSEDFVTVNKALVGPVNYD